MAKESDTGISEAISHIQKDVKSLGTEVRTISYLLHPPLLDEMGLLVALRCYVDGFQERSRISVSLRLPNQMKRLPQGLEITIFRIAQECLTNVYRHSGSATASLELRCLLGGGISMVISDRGRGIPSQKVRQIAGRSCSGVGLRGIEERARLYGGYVEILSGRSGTAVRIVVPGVGETTNG